MPHQQQAIDFIASRPASGVWLGVGAGKTITALSALQLIRPLGHILVIAPVAIARSTWLDEIEERGFTIRTRSLIVDDRDRKLNKQARRERILQVFTDPPTMYFINQELIARSPDKRCKVCHGDGLKDRTCTACQTGLVDQMPIQKLRGADGKIRDTIIWPFQTVIIDESQEFKSHASNRFKGLKKVRPAISRFIELTGTPAPNGLEDLWSQIYLLDQGQALGETITEFRRRWFTPKMIPGTTTPAAWLPNTGAEQQIHRVISHLVMSAQNTAVVLPPLTIENIHVKLPVHLMDAYKAFKRELVIDVINEAARRKAELAYEQWMQHSPQPEAQVIRDHLATLTGTALSDAYEKFKASKIQDFLHDPDAQLIKTVIAENQAVLTSKLMQFASGTLYTADPDDPSTKGQYEILHDEKVQMTEYLIRNNGGDPVLVAYHFKSDREQLMLKLNRAGIKAEIFDGSREMKQRWSSKQIQVMLIHPASAGAGLNLQHGGSTMIWYTLPFSLKHYLQTNGRLFRTGQTKPVRIYQLITKGTQDERMPVALQTKELTQDRLIQAVDVEANLKIALMEEIGDDLNDLWTTMQV
ncbi:SNF2-related protein [Psychromicrobium sp. YIM B11713]|uniref:SNF2-related protein n=1 Tax=Psychromicrobium sp. YIM B11713 TaxID=3145233 RepID=UPI00374E5C23